MYAQTLLLDASYQPIGRLPWTKVIVRVLERVAEVIDEYPDKYVNTVNWSVKVPSVVRLVKPISRRKAIKFSRNNVYLRDHGRCQYCSTKVSRDNFSYEHVVPRAQGGKTSWTNIVVSCNACNQKKGAHTPEQAGMHLRSTPVRPKSLPEAPRRGFCFASGMPESWRAYLRDETYWNVELEHDDE